jgi:ketosteroid isomerase-like protein
MSERAGWPGLIEAFGKGWEKGKLDWIEDVFSEDAVFFPDPFGKPFTGRLAIESYWRDVPREQSEISFRFGEIFAVGPWFSTEFRCTFRRRRTGAWMDVRGALFCETADGLISEMRMYWHRSQAGDR